MCVYLERCTCAPTDIVALSIQPTHGTLMSVASLMTSPAVATSSMTSPAAVTSSSMTSSTVAMTRLRACVTTCCCACWVCSTCETWRAASEVSVQSVSTVTQRRAAQTWYCGSAVHWQHASTDTSGSLYLLLRTKSQTLVGDQKFGLKPN